MAEAEILNAYPDLGRGAKLATHNIEDIEERGFSRPSRTRAKFGSDWRRFSAKRLRFLTRKCWDG
jgi:hypothetical protein